MSWVFLLLSIIFEIAFASSLKFTDGYARLWPSIGNAALAIACIFTLAQAVKNIPYSIAYPIWTGTSLIGIIILGKYMFGETIGVWHMVFMSMIVVGAIGLKAL